MDALMWCHGPLFGLQHQFLLAASGRCILTNCPTACSSFLTAEVIDTAHAFVVLIPAGIVVHLITCTLLSPDGSCCAGGGYRITLCTPNPCVNTPYNHSVQLLATCGRGSCHLADRGRVVPAHQLRKVGDPRCITCPWIVFVNQQQAVNRNEVHIFICLTVLIDVVAYTCSAASNGSMPMLGQAAR